MSVWKKLCEMGFLCHTSHHRMFSNIGVKRSETEIDQILTRGEYDEAREQEQLAFTEMGLNTFAGRNPKDVAYGEAVLPNGGFTTVKLLNEATGQEFIGKCSFRKTEAFFRRKGRWIAVMRAMQNSGIESLLSLKKEVDRHPDWQRKQRNSDVSGTLTENNGQ